jgi:hypothetical protein
MNILDIDKLEQFDILLVRFPDDETSIQIRQTCDSNYSHAIIYLGNGSFIEGIEPIVGLFSYHRYYFEDLENVQVLRLNVEYKSKLDFKLTEEFLRRLSYCNYSRRLLYHINQRNISNEIIMNFLSEQVWQGGIVCTSLVTLPYFIGGIDISKKNEPFYAHFGDIEKFEGFEDVTTVVFKEIEPRDLREDTFDYLTTYKTGSLLERQSEIAKELNIYVQNKHQDILRNPEKYQDIMIDKKNLGFSTWEDIFPNIMRWYLTETGQTIDKELSELLLESGYHLLWFEEVHKEKEQFFPLYYHPFTKFKIKDLEFLRDTLQGTYDRMQVNENNIFNNFTLCPCRTFHILLDMYRSFSDLLRSSINQYNGLIIELKKASP